MDKPNILFLDIDGVVNSDKYHREHISYLCGIERDPEVVKMINEFCNECNCKIVISSSWRHEEHLMKILRNDFPGLIIGTTLTDTEERYKDYYSRSAEINTWLIEHKGEWNNFIVFDDQRLDFKGHPNYIRTSASVGLTDKNVDAARLVLGYEPKKYTKSELLEMNDGL